MISYRRVEKESDELLVIRFGLSLWSANQLLAQEVKILPNSQLDRHSSFTRLLPFTRTFSRNTLPNPTSFLRVINTRPIRVDRRVNYSIYNTGKRNTITP